MRRSEGKKQALKTVQYTVRGIPARVDQELRSMARMRGISLNRLAVDLLTAASGVSRGRRRRSLKGIPRWEEDPEFDKTIEAQRQIDWDLWR